MGRFKNYNLIESIIDFLKSQEYELWNDNGLSWSKDYETNGLFVRVTFDFKYNSIYICKKYYSGDEIDNTTIIIEDKWLKNIDTFIDEVDKILEPWIG